VSSRIYPAWRREVRVGDAWFPASGDSMPTPA
jgi:hypothetical protein